MKVLRSEGVANHTGPESCVAGREAIGEALTGMRVPGAGARTRGRKRAVLRHTREVGARCPNGARRDLCGGRGVTRVPTAIEGTKDFNKFLVPLRLGAFVVNPFSAPQVRNVGVGTL